jgi:hypothetical protein
MVGNTSSQFDQAAICSKQHSLEHKAQRALQGLQVWSGWMTVTSKAAT